MATKKKTTRRKKKVTEQQKFTVSMKKGDDVTGGQDVEKTVDAQNADAALDQAKQGDNTQYDSVEIKKANGGGGRVRTQPQTQAQTAAATSPSASSMESLEYPYNIGLPKTFEPLVESLTKKTRESLSIHERYSRVHITVPDKKAMTNLVEELDKKSRGRTKVKGMASIVRNGIAG